MHEAMRRDEAGLPVSLSRRRVSDWMDDWLNDHKAGQIRNQSLINYQDRLALLAPAIGQIPLARLTSADIRRAVSALRTTKAPSTVDNALQTLRSCLGDAVKEGLLISNPATPVKRPRVPQKQHRFISMEEVTRLIDKEPHPMWRALWALLAVTAMRHGEARALRWSDVDLAAGIVHIEATLVQIPGAFGGGLERGEPKTESSRRLIHIGRTTAALLAVWQREQPPRIDRLVFNSPTGKRLSAKTVNTYFHRACFRAGIARMTPHDLRHTAASNLLARGEPITVVSEMLGHKSTSTTLDIYGHTIPAMHAAAAERLDGLLDLRDDTR